MSTSEKNIQSKETVNLNDLLATLECPVCLDFFQTPIYMCNTGHNVCCACNKKLNPKICPLCQSPMGTLRNFSLEQIVEKFGVKCKNAEFGCTFIGNKTTLQGHKISCLFKQYICPMKKTYNMCVHNWKGTYQEFLSHFKSAHSTMLVVKASETFFFDKEKIDTKCDGLVLLTTDLDVLFVLHFKIRPDKGLIYWTVQKMDSYYTVPEFKYTIEISGVDNKVSISFPCTSSLKSFTTLFDSGNCAILPLSLIKNFLDDQEKLLVIVHIDKKSDEGITH